jgi:hypothetical protein
MVEGEDLAGTGLGIALVGEAGDDAGSFVEKRQRLAGVLDSFQRGVRIVLGLVLDGGDVLAEDFLLGLRDTDRFSINEEDEIGRAAVGGVFADGLALALVEVDGVLVLNGPAGGAELGVDPVTGFLLGILVRHLRERHPTRHRKRQSERLMIGEAFLLARWWQQRVLAVSGSDCSVSQSITGARPPALSRDGVRHRGGVCGECEGIDKF